MKIEQVGQPGPNAIHGAKAEAQVHSRDVAIAKLQALMNQDNGAEAIKAQVASAPAQQYPVQNPSQVSPEESSIVMPQESKQNHISEEIPSESAPEEKPSPLSQQHAILARREKQIRLREMQLREKERALAQKPAEQPAPSTPAFDPSKYIPKDRLTQDPFTVLNELGLTYEQLTDLVLKGPSQQDMQTKAELASLKAELEKVKSETENTKKSWQESQDQQYAQAISQIRAEAKSLIKNDPSYEAIRASGTVKDVVELIDRTFKKHGVLLSVEEAASEVENHLVEEAMRFTKLGKIQSRLKPASQSATPNKQDSAQSSAQQPAKTLTNSMGSSKKLSAVERAKLAFEGKLPK